MLLAERLLGLPAPAAASGSAMVAADSGDGGLFYGYAATGNAGGISPCGSLTPDDPGGFTVIALGDFFGVQIYVELVGDQTSALSGKKLVIDGNDYLVSGAASGPTYDSGSDTTTVGWTPVYGFVDSGSYTVDIV